jgi:hypothetical protein
MKNRMQNQMGIYGSNSLFFYQINPFHFFCFLLSGKIDDVVLGFDSVKEYKVIFISLLSLSFSICLQFNY